MKGKWYGKNKNKDPYKNIFENNESRQDVAEKLPHKTKKHVHAPNELKKSMDDGDG